LLKVEDWMGTVRGGVFFEFSFIVKSLIGRSVVDVEMIQFSC